MRNQLVYITLILLLLTGIAYSGDTTLTCSMFRLKLRDGSGTGGTNGRLDGKLFTGIDWDKKPIRIEATQIVRIDTSVGTHALEWAAVGAIMGVSAAVALSRSKSDNRDSPTNDPRPLFGRGVLLVSGGAAVGALFGAFFTAWKPIQWVDIVPNSSELGVLSCKVSFSF